MIGQLLLNRYRVVRLLDQGGMSNIYLGKDEEANRDVVIKGLQPQLATSKTRDHFRREVHIMSRFQHPNAVAYFDSDMEHPKGPLIVMEYLRGLDLHALIHQQGRFSLDYAGLLLMQLCDVLQSAHDAGIVHRDLKPGNLMIVHPRTPQCLVKLMDFGLAKMTSLLYIAPDEVFDYQLPPTAGTPEYIAPEQVRNSEMDHRGDLYSVGVILFEMLTGRRPFTGKTPQELMLAHMQQQPPSLTACGLREPVPAAVEKLIQDCLAKHPEARPSSAMELATRFEMALGRRLQGVRE